MKKFALALILLFPFAAQAQQFNSRIIPTPQRVERTEGFFVHQEELLEYIEGNYDAKKAARHIKKGGWVLRSGLVDSIPGAPQLDEAYQIEVKEHEVTIRATNWSGIQYGYLSFDMMYSMWDDTIPCMTITDWPDYEYRGWMDDLSRGPVTNADFRTIQRTFGHTFKMNYYNLYTEHVQYNPSCPEVAPLPVKKVEYSPMANLQCFAHFEKTLQIPFYQDMKDTRYNLDPSKEESYRFLKEQIDNTMKYYPYAKFFNINCDETESLGSGRARDYVASVGADEAYVRHINRVFDLLKPYDVEVLMWGDIVGKNPAMLERLPREMQYIMWSYVPADDFSSMLRPFKELKERQGNPFWVASGVSHWSSIMPSQHNYIKNIANLTRDGFRDGARGTMCTAWDDNGESLFADAWHAMAWSAEVAWNAHDCDQKWREEQFNENYDRLLRVLSHCPVEHMSQLLYAIGDLAQNPYVGDWYQASSLWEGLLEFYPSKVDDALLTRCDSAEALAQRILDRYQLPALGHTQLSWDDEDILTSLPHAIYALHHIQVTAQKARLRALLYRTLQGEPCPTLDSTKALYFRNLHLLEQEYLRLWDFECTDYSRHIITDRYNHYGNELLEADRHVFASTFARDGKTYVELKNLGHYPIYYTLDGRKPSQASALYTQPFELQRSCEVKAVSYDPWGEGVQTDKYLLLHKGMGHLRRLNTPYSTYRDTYSAGGDNALLDGEMGSDNTYNDGHWQGYWGQDIDLELDFGKPTPVNHIAMRFLQNSTDWILAPKQIEVYSSKDGQQWTLVRTEHYEPDFRAHGNIVRNNALRELNLNTRYLRVVAKNPGPLPDYTPGAGYDSYLFCDEIVIE